MRSFRYAFIVGVGRSGTTLLSALLNRHPDVSVTPETHFLRLIHRYRGGLGGVLTEWPRSLEVVVDEMRKFSTERWMPDAERLGALLTRPPTSEHDLAELFKCVIQDACNQNDAPVLIEKTPTHIQWVPWLRRYFPNSPIIHVLRDGRAVAASLRRMPWWPKGFGMALAYWQYWTGWAKTWQGSDPRWIEVRYEDLTGDPEAELRRLCYALEVPYSETCLTPAESDAGLIERGATHKDGIHRKVSRQRQSAWRSELTPEMIDLADGFISEGLRHAGYSVPGQDDRQTAKVWIGSRDGTRNQWLSFDQILIDLSQSRRLCFGGFASPLARVSKRDVWLTTEDLASEVIWQPGTLNKIRVLVRLLINTWSNGARFIWIYPNRERCGRSKWVAQLIEKMIARSVTVVCPCDSGDDCSVYTTLKVPRERVRHAVGQEQPNR